MKSHLICHAKDKNALDLTQFRINMRRKNSWPGVDPDQVMDPRSPNLETKHVGSLSNCPEAAFHFKIRLANLDFQIHVMVVICYPQSPTDLFVM